LALYNALSAGAVAAKDAGDGLSGLRVAGKAFQLFGGLNVHETDE
jgi:hypothetical protein